MQKQQSATPNKDGAQHDDQETAKSRPGAGRVDRVSGLRRRRIDVAGQQSRVDGLQIDCDAMRNESCKTETGSNWCVEEGERSWERSTNVERLSGGLLHFEFGFKVRYCVLASPADVFWVPWSVTACAMERST